MTITPILYTYHNYTYLPIIVIIVFTDGVVADCKVDKIKSSVGIAEMESFEKVTFEITFIKFKI